MRQPQSLPDGNTSEPLLRAAREAAIREKAADDGPVRRRVIELYTKAAGDWFRAPEAISRGMREARELSSAERRFVGDMVFELVRHRRRLAFLVGTGEPAALLDGLLRPAGDGDARIAALESPLERLAIATSCPDFLVEKMIAAFGIEAATRLLVAMNRRAPLVVRANLLKIDRDALAARLLDEDVPSHPTPSASAGLILDTRKNVYELAAFKEGLLELQDEGSQLIAELCAPPPRGTVVDACAGAGGKTLALAGLLKNRGRLLALDVSERRLGKLRVRARRAGLTNFQALEVPPTGPPAGTPPADRVLVDAPCSGLGVLRRNPETKWRLTPFDLEELPRRQRALLDAYAPLVKVGGRLIYATCSVLPDENEQVVEAFLSAHPGFERVPAKEIFGKERALAIGDGTALRMSPVAHDTDGFFAQAMRRRA